MKQIAALGLALAIMGGTVLNAQITIPTVTVGDAGNAADTTGYGAVSQAYNIAVTEVNLFQYTAFLNAVAATDTYSLYNPNMGTDLNIAGITQSGSSGSYSYAVTGSGNRPVTYVSWFDAARFANWVHNGATNGASTEDGAYTLAGAMSGVGISKNAGATYWIPSENEWYKAAYYKGGGTNAGYWLYATQSNSAPGNTIGAGSNQANCYDGDHSVTQSSSFSASQNYLTDGGAFSSSGSYYGTFDQGGNVWEWNDAVIDPSRGLRGGSWFSSDSGSQSSGSRIFLPPTVENFAFGFRVASVPEPSTALLMTLGGAGWLLWRRRKVSF